MSKEQDIQRFETLAQNFNPVTPAEANKLIEAEEGHIIFVGRETCPYCRKFIVALSEAAGEANLVINYLHAEKADYIEETKKLRETYDVKTVPGLIFSDEDGVQVVCDSSLSKEEILKFVKH